MDQEQQKEDETVVASAELVVDFDPAQYPCHLLAQMWYELLALPKLSEPK